MANLEKRCLICDSVILVGRMHRHPSAVLCGSAECELVQHRRNVQRAGKKARCISEYKPPAPGASDSADPHFRAKRRPCGRCGEEFTTTPRWRYFCECCRASTAVKRPPVDRSYALSNSR